MQLRAQWILICFIILSVLLFIYLKLTVKKKIHNS